MRILISILMYVMLGVLWDLFIIFFHYKGEITFLEYYEKCLRNTWIAVYNVYEDPENVMPKSVIVVLMIGDILLWPISIALTAVFGLYFFIKTLRD